MLLVNLIDLTLDFFFANDRLTLVMLEALQDPFMIDLHLILLLLFLLKLQLYEFKLLIRDSAVLDGLTLERFILFFKLPDDFFKVLDSLSVCSLLVGLLVVVLLNVGVILFLQCFVCC